MSHDLLSRFQCKLRHLTWFYLIRPGFAVKAENESTVLFPAGGPNTGSGRYWSGTDTKPLYNVRIWYQGDLVTACTFGLARPG
jgi:hypothetical protein